MKHEFYDCGTEVINLQGGDVVEGFLHDRGMFVLADAGQFTEQFLLTTPGGEGQQVAFHQRLQEGKLRRVDILLQ